MTRLNRCSRLVINVGLIGCGMQGLAHVRTLSRIENAKLVACCDINPKAAEDAAKTVGGKAYTKWADMVKREELDALVVVVPPFAHGFEVDLVEKGFHIMVEKPVALTLDVAERIEKAILKAGVVSSVCYTSRYRNTTGIAKKVIQESGPIGFVEGWSIEPFWHVWASPGHWFMEKGKGGGYVVESATHIYDLARYLAGDVLRVYAEADNLLLTDLKGYEVEDVSVATMRFKNNAVGVISSSCSSRKTYYAGHGVRTYTKKAVVDLGYGVGGAATPTLKIYGDAETKELQEPPNANAQLEQDRIFIDAVATADLSQIRSDYSDGVKTLRLTLAANEASARKQVITLDS